MGNNTKDTGSLGERMAVEHLRGKGYEILAVNWRYRHLEIDIVARHKDTIVIVEVKTRGSRSVAAPEVFVDRRKQQLLIRAANAYLEQYPTDSETRFDIISVIHAGEKSQVTHIEDAFYPTLR